MRTHCGEFGPSIESLVHERSLKTSLCSRIFWKPEESGFKDARSARWFVASKGLCPQTCGRNAEAHICISHLDPGCYLDLRPFPHKCDGECPSATELCAFPGLGIEYELVNSPIIFKQVKTLKRTYITLAHSSQY